MTHASAMNHPLAPEAFELRPSDEPLPLLLDEDPVTTVWPMPPVKPWNPMPRRSRFSLWFERTIGYGGARKPLP